MPGLSAGALQAAENARKAAEEKEKDRAKRLEALKLRREQNKAAAPGVSKIAAAGAGPKPLSRFGAGAAAGKVAPSAAAGTQNHQHAALNKTTHAQRRADDDAARCALDAPHARVAAARTPIEEVWSLGPTEHPARAEPDRPCRKARDEQERKERQERIKRMHEQREKIRCFRDLRALMMIDRRAAARIGGLLRGSS